jgi:hypothetical protein
VKQKVVVTLCDECGKAGPTTIVRIGTAENLRRLDLCVRCIDPANSLMELAERVRPKRRSVTAMPLMSIEDVLLRRTPRPRRALRRPETGLQATQPPTLVPPVPVFSDPLAGPLRGTSGFSTES